MSPPACTYAQKCRGAVHHMLPALSEHFETGSIFPFDQSTESQKVHFAYKWTNYVCHFLETMIIIFAMIVSKKVVCAIVHEQAGTPQLN